jgi:hypothetical protein
MKHDLFISYSRVDSAFALRLVGDLKQRGVEAWLDQLDIPAGVNWDNEIEAALDHAQTVVVILSSVSSKSENVKNEIGAALERGKQIVPIVVAKGAVPLIIQRLQREDFTGDYEAALAKLMRRLSGGSRTASLKAMSPEEVTRTASQAAARLGVSASSAEPDSLLPRTVEVGSAEAGHKRNASLLFAALGGAAIAGGVLFFALNRAPQAVEPGPQSSPTPAPAAEASTHAAAAPVAQPPTAAQPSAAVPAAVGATTAQKPATPRAAGPIVRGHANGNVQQQPVEPTPTDTTPTDNNQPATEPSTPTAQPTASKRPSAVLCRERNYGGICRKVPTLSDLMGTIIDNDTVSSLKLGGCRSVTLCSNIDFGGACTTFTSDMPDLDGTQVGDDSASSIMCESGDEGSPVTGPATE